ncbi:hypothetical protein KQI63_06780 [bacterium]|nr:hypothetical protein [bacterium]
MFWNRKESATTDEMNNGSFAHLPTDREGTVDLSDRDLQTQVRYHGLRADTLGYLVAAGPHLSDSIPKMARALIDKVRSRPAIWASVEKLPQATKLDSIAASYLKGLLTGPLDNLAVTRATSIGSTLAQHDIDPMWFTGLSGYLQFLCLDCLKKANIAPEDQLVFTEQLGNRLSFEASIVMQGHEHTLKQQASEQLRQFEKERNEFISNLCSAIREAASIGDLTSRSDLHQFPEEYRDLVQAMNELLDSILNPLREAIDVLQHVKNRDLTMRILGEYSGDHHLIPNALNPALDHLNEALSQVVNSIVEVEQGAAKLADTSGSLSSGATEQASSLEEIRATVDQVTSQNRSNSEGAEKASQLAENARQHADSGSAEMGKMVEAMEAIEDSSGQISRIIKVIEEIAFQTNLLSLNAAVEAARAGVHGKGFAVVADEVRTLAQRSAKAAKETNDLIKGTVDRVKNGAQIAHTTSDALGEIVTTVNEVSTVIREIATASVEQTQAIEQVNDALGQIENVTQHTAANAEESASVSEQLSAEARQLREMISAFKIQGVSNRALTGQVRNAPRRPQRKLAAPSNGGQKQSSAISSMDDIDFGDF